MNFDGFVAKRYLRAKRKQAFIGVISLITLIGIALGVATLNIALSVHNGMQGAFLHSLVGETGSLHIISRRFYVPGLNEEDRGKRERGFNAGEVARILAVVDDMPSVQAHARMRMEPMAIFGEQRSMRFVKVHGILPDEFLRASDTLSRLESGSVSRLSRRTPDDLPGIILGSDLARNMGLIPDDTIVVVAGRLSSPGFTRQGLQFKRMKCRVAGIFKTGNSQFDEFDAYVHLDELFGLLGTDKVESVLVKFTDIGQMDKGKQRLILDEDMPLFATVIDFRELNQGLLRALQLEKLATTTIISLFILIVALNMISALIMLVMEKHRDIGIMRSFGAPRKTILRIFLRQGMTLSFWGTLMGTVLGVLLAWIADATKLIRLDNSVYEVLNYLPFKIRAEEVLLVALGSLALSFITAIYPARQAAALNPVEALKYD